ncbi:hypothetical protein D3C87_1615770 [compost metagenome]
MPTGHEWSGLRAGCRGRAQSPPSVRGSGQIGRNPQACRCHPRHPSVPSSWRPEPTGTLPGSQRSGRQDYVGRPSRSSSVSVKWAWLLPARASAAHAPSPNRRASGQRRRSSSGRPACAGSSVRRSVSVWSRLHSVSPRSSRWPWRSQPPPFGLGD